MSCHVMSCHHSGMGPRYGLGACHVMSCHVMPCHVMSCHVMSCPAMSCHVMSCHVMSCHAMLYHVLPRASSRRGGCWGWGCGWGWDRGPWLCPPSPLLLTKPSTTPNCKPDRHTENLERNPTLGLALGDWCNPSLGVALGGWCSPTLQHYATLTPILTLTLTQAKLASVLGCAVGDALPARTAESLGGYEQIVPSAAFDAVKAEYNSNVRDPKPRRRHH